MTLGDKIRKIRTMRGLSQKELGIKIGFPSPSADSRIRKYESDAMAPKKAIWEKLVAALDVDGSALSDINIRNYEDVMQVLFYLEEELGLEIERTEDKTSLVFDNHNPEIADLISYLYTWYVRKKNLRLDDPETSGRIGREYKIWKSRFPMDVNKYWDEQYSLLEEIYKPRLYDRSLLSHRITRLSEYILQVRKLFQKGFDIDVATIGSSADDIALVMSFRISQLLEPNNTVIRVNFTDFLYNVKTLHEYGMPYYKNITSNESGTKLSIFLQWSVLASFGSMIRKIQDFELNKSTLSDFEIDSFEEDLAYELKQYDINLKAELQFSDDESEFDDDDLLFSDEEDF